VRTRLLASYLLFACALLVILEIPLGLIESDVQTRASFSFLDRQTAALGTLTAEDLESGNFAVLREAATSFAQRATGIDVTVFDRNGFVVLSTGPSANQRVAIHARTQLVLSGQPSVTGRAPNPRGGHDLIFETRPVGVATGTASGSPNATAAPGILVLTYSTSRLDARIRSIDLALVGVGLGVLATATVLALFMSRSLSRPVVEITGAVGRIAGGDLSARAPTTHGPPELRTLATSVNAMAARLDHLLDAQRAFVADASHQLRSPLTAMRLRLENLRARVDGPGQADVEACASEVARLSRLVDGLLALARAEQANVGRAVVELDAVALDRQEAWAPLADERGVLLELQVGDNPTCVRAVPGHLEQVLDNLIDNAVEVTPPGRQVQLVVHNGGPTVEVHVVDQGPGMTAEERRRAFDRFWRGSDTEAGSGLGLAIVRQLVEACGGTVELRGGDGGGIDATVTLERA
jgi:signal transduction histidine kinase